MGGWLLVLGVTAVIGGAWYITSRDARRKHDAELARFRRRIAAQQKRDAARRDGSADDTQ